VWTLEQRSVAARLAAGAVYAAAVVAFLLAQELGLRLQREEHRAWWAGNGRDLLNLAGLFAIGGALRVVGLTWPASLLVGGTLTLVLFGTSVFVATQTATRHPRAWAFGAGVVFAAPVLLWTADVLGAIAAVAGALFPAVAPPPR
jgi:hypothetical protein